MNVSPLCPQLMLPVRILIVADGEIHFGPRCNGFTLMELLKILRSSSLPPVDITTALRGKDAKDCKCTCNVDFRFDGDLFKNGKFDQVWLFGHLDETDPPLSESEVEAVLEFMNRGGGVFATGDHKSLGAAMCGKLPRVGSMRKWYYRMAPSLELKAPGKEDATRLDTLRVGLDLGFQVDDQSDGVAQEIRPKFFLTNDGNDAKPHPLLADKSGFAITVLPDHMHEGECLVPTNLERRFPCNGKQCDEYPKIPGVNPPTRLAPQVVAISTSATGYMLIVGKSIPPVEPRSFVSIVAYDGDQVRVGRVAVDASFHHFLDINLRGTGAANRESRGFFDECGNPTRDYVSFTKYYQNIARWLSSPDVRFDMYTAMLVDLRFNTFLIEDLTPIPNPTLQDLLYVGALTRKAISERFSDVVAIECALAYLKDLDAEPKRLLESVMNPWVPSSLGLSSWIMALNQEFLIEGSLGWWMLKVVNELPYNSDEALQRLNPESLPDLFRPAVNEASPTLLTVLRESIERLKYLSETLLNTAIGSGGQIDSIDASRVNVSNRALAEEAEMAGMCRTEDDEFWDSDIIRNGQRFREGSFRITEETQQGFFEGVFVHIDGRTEPISGRCTGARMTFDRGRFHYDGIFVHDRFVRGTRTSPSLTGDADVRDSESARPATEEWEGTKVTTFLEEEA